MATTEQIIRRLGKLKSTLLTSGLSQRDQPLFQVINALIDAQIDSAVDVVAITGGGGSTGALSDRTYLTATLESTNLPNSRELIAGTNVTFDDTTPNSRIVNASGGGSAGAVGAPGINGIDGEDGFDGFPGPVGPRGPQGAIGPSGITGSPGIPGLDGLDGEDAFPIPGPTGPRGATGATGPAGLQGIPGPSGLDAEEPEYPYIIPGPRGATGPSGGGGGGSSTIVEVDLGSSFIFRGKFTITDGTISGTSKVLVWQAPGPYTGKGTLADEADLQPVSIIAAVPGAGVATVYWQTPPYLTFSINPQMQGITGAAQSPKDIQAMAQGIALRLGRVRGNVKFAYMVM